MRCLRIVIMLFASLLLVCTVTDAQRLDVRGVRKKSKAADCATIIFKSDFDSLTIIGMSSDTIYKKKGCDYNNVWTQYVDLRYERERGDTMINRRFVLHTPYTIDREIIVPGAGRELRQSIYEYRVSMFDYYPMRVTFEMDIVRLKDYFGFRVSAGKRFGGYVSVKLGTSRRGFNAEESSDEVDISKKSYVGRIRNSYMAGIKYGIASRDYPIFLYGGVGYGDNGIQRSNGKKKKERVAYYNNYTRGFESELGVNVILLEVVSLSMGTDVVFGHRVAFDINCSIGFAIDLTE